MFEQCIGLDARSCLLTAALVFPLQSCAVITALQPERADMRWNLIDAAYLADICAGCADAWQGRLTGLAQGTWVRGTPNVRLTGANPVLICCSTRCYARLSW